MQYRKRNMLKSLRACYGIITDACADCGVSRKTFYQWLKDDEEFKKAYQDIRDVTLDHVEGKLFKKMESGNIAALIFYLKCKGKDRGYIERVENNMSGELKVRVERKIIKGGNKSDKK